MTSSSQYFAKKRKLRESSVKCLPVSTQPIRIHTTKEPKLPEIVTRLKYRESFFNVSCVELACNLLGKTLVRHLENGERLSGVIVETEGYLGENDKASHSYQGKQTTRNAPMFMKPGTAYVYLTYGMHYCFNISSKGDGAAVLIRAVEPLEGLDRMKENRGLKRKDGGASLKEKDLCNGPSKMCQAMQINKDLVNGQDLVSSSLLWIENGNDIDQKDIIMTSRIGIGPSAGDWMTKPLRYYIRGNSCVSVRDRKQELNQANT